MSEPHDLAEKVTDEHTLTRADLDESSDTFGLTCSCGHKFAFPDQYAYHLATAMEKAVRAEVVKAIDRAALNTSWTAKAAGLFAAADIAKGRST